jgi:hypothetical protein
MSMSIRLLGILLAAAIALVTVVVVQVIPALSWTYLNVGPYTPFAVYPILVASLAAALVAPRLREGLGHGIGEVLAMAIATYLIAILLFPIGMAITGGTAATDEGGACTSIIGCRLGGDAALQAYYALTPLAILFFLPALPVILVPSAAWVLVMRWLVLDDSWTDPYARSV